MKIKNLFIFNCHWCGLVVLLCILLTIILIKLLNFSVNRKSFGLLLSCLIFFSLSLQRRMFRSGLFLSHLLTDKISKMNWVTENLLINFFILLTRILIIFILIKVCPCLTLSIRNIFNTDLFGGPLIDYQSSFFVYICIQPLYSLRYFFRKSS